MIEPLLAPEAERDVVEAYRWYRRINTALSLRFEAAFESSMRKIGEAPFSMSCSIRDIASHA